MNFQKIVSFRLTKETAQPALALFIGFCGIAATSYGLASIVVRDPASPATAVTFSEKACYTARDINLRQEAQNKLTAVTIALASELETRQSELRSLKTLLSDTNKDIDTLKKGLSTKAKLDAAEKRIETLKKEERALTQRRIRTTAENTRLAKVVAEIFIEERALATMKNNDLEYASTSAPLIALKDEVTASIKSTNTEITRIKSEQKSNASELTAATRRTRDAQAKSCGATSKTSTSTSTYTGQACYTRSERTALQNKVTEYQRIIDETPAQIVGLRAENVTDAAILKTQQKETVLRLKAAPTEKRFAEVTLQYETATERYEAANAAPVGSTLYKTRTKRYQELTAATNTYTRLRAARDAYESALQFETSTVDRIARRNTFINEHIAKLEEAQDSIDSAKQSLAEAPICTNNNGTGGNGGTGGNNNGVTTPDFMCDDGYGVTYEPTICQDGTQVCGSGYCPPTDNNTEDSCSDDQNFDHNDLSTMGSGWTWSGSIFGTQFGNAICGATVGICRRGYEWDTNDPTQNGNWTCVLRQKNVVGKQKCADLGLNPDEIVNSKVCPGF